MENDQKVEKNDQKPKWINHYRADPKVAIHIGNMILHRKKMGKPLIDRNTIVYEIRDLGIIDIAIIQLKRMVTYEMDRLGFAYWSKSHNPTWDITKRREL